MKIAFLNKYQNKVNRGAETFILELSKRLSVNHHVDVVSEINYLDFFSKKYDVIIPTNGRWQVIIMRLITWLNGTKLIVSGQSGMGWDDKINLIVFPNAFIALSETAKNWASKFNPLVRIETIPNGVDVSKFTPHGVSYKTKLKEPVVLAVGAFTKQKRLELAIQAVAKIKNVSLLIAGGGGELRGELEALCNKLLPHRFEIVSVPFEKMPGVYRAADLFTLPSASSESFGNVLVEAMASGLPVVATNDPIRKEIVGSSGILVDPENINFYSMAIENALTRKWGDKPEWQARKFSWDDIAKKYEKLLEEITHKK